MNEAPKPNPPYPRREWLKPAATAADVIGEELRVGHEPTVMRSSMIKELGAIYGNSTLGLTLQKYAYIYSKVGSQMKIMQGKDIDIDTSRWQLNAFTSGGLLALHAEVSILPSDQRKYLLDLMCHDLIYADPEDALEASYYLALADETLDLQTRISEIFDSLPKDMQKILLSYTEAAYSDLPESTRGITEAEFLSGYLHAHSVIDELKEHYNYE
jgi:hypothetical protein